MSAPPDISLPCIDCCAFVKALLSADEDIARELAAPGEAIRIHFGDVEVPVYPLIRMTVMSAPNNFGNKRRRISSPVLLRVEAIDQNSHSGRIVGLRRRIEHLLTNPPTGNAGSSTIQGSSSENDIAVSPEIIENVSYSRLGGDFRFFVHQKV